MNWKFVAEMNEKRVNFQVVSCGKFMWVIDDMGAHGSITNPIEYYDDFTAKFYQ